MELPSEALVRRRDMRYAYAPRERGMDGADRKLVVYFEEEEHIVRRLGAAVISCWEDIPKPVRAKLVERATRVLDADETGEFDQQLKTFIKEHTARR